MNDDTIKRSDAIKGLCDAVDAKKYGEYLYTDEFCKVINAIPSADRPQGEWIGGDVPTRCSICGHDWDEYVEGQEIWYEGSIPNFCPNCGRRMKGADDE